MISSIPIQYYNFQTSYFLIDEIQTGTTTTLGQSEPGSNGNEGILHTPQISSLTTRYSFVSYQEHPFFCRKVLPLCKEYSQHILSPTDRIGMDTEVASVLFHQLTWKH